LAGLVGTVMGGFMLDRVGIRKLFVLSAWLELTSIFLFGL
jgi:predicted MFS family arabinose efflux permease